MIKVDLSPNIQTPQLEACELLFSFSNFLPSFSKDIRKRKYNSQRARAKIRRGRTEEVSRWMALVTTRIYSLRTERTAALYESNWIHETISGDKNIWHVSQWHVFTIKKISDMVQTSESTSLTQSIYIWKSSQTQLLRRRKIRTILSKRTIISRSCLKQQSFYLSWCSTPRIKNFKNWCLTTNNNFGIRRLKSTK